MLTPYPMSMLVREKSLFAMVAGIAFAIVTLAAIFSLLGINELCRYKHTTRNPHSLPRLARRAPIA